MNLGTNSATASNQNPGDRAVSAPASNAPPLTATNPTSPVTNFSLASTNSGWDRLAERLQAKGLHLVNSNQVSELFNDPRYGRDWIIFVDARDDENYRAGHIPGAYLLDYFHPDKYLPTVWPVCQAAEKVIVYCNGGDCQDSELAALMLRDSGLPKEKLFVYGGGITEWATNGLPVELNERKSGKFQNAKK